MNAQDLILAFHGASVIEQRQDCLIVKIPLRLDAMPSIDNPPFESLPPVDDFQLTEPSPEEPHQNVRDWFDAVFWPMYPRKVGKAAARAAAIRKAKEPQVRADIIAGLKAQLPDLLSREPEYIPHAATWLNQERWTDAIETGPAPRPKSKQEKIADEIRKEYGVKE